ncbi:MAG: aspartate 1-decarboxylase [Phycisphaerae bacterium]
MFLKLMKSKIHRATVTEANLNYVGSITIDRDLMEAVDLLPNEAVMVANLNNGTRHTTYAIPGPAGSGIICINGAAARLVNVGDIVLVFSFAYMTPEEARNHKARVAIIGQGNTIKEVITH